MRSLAQILRNKYKLHMHENSLRRTAPPPSQSRPNPHPRLSSLIFGLLFCAAFISATLWRQRPPGGDEDEHVPVLEQASPPRSSQ